MSSNYRDFMQRQMGGNDNRDDEATESMRQMFGNTPDNNKFTETPQQTDKKEFNPEDIPIPVKEGLFRKGFIVFGILLLVQSLFLLSGLNIFGFVGGAIMAVVSFLLAWKVKYRYTNDSNFYFYHLTVTLNGVLNHFRTTSILYEVAEKIFIYSVALMAIQHFLLSWFSLTSILYSIGYYGMLFGIILVFAKRKTTLLAKGLILYSIVLSLMTLQNAFGSFHYVNYHTVLSLFLFWYLAGLFHSMSITDNSEDTLEIDMEALTENKDETEDDLL